MPRLRRALTWSFALIALLLVASAVWSVFLSRSAERRFPRTGTPLAARLALQPAVEIRLNALERGQGQPIVLLHGAFGAVQDWDATIMDELSTRYRVIALDRPGHGYSERVPGRINDLRVQAEALRAALRELHVERPVLVGFSFGGSVALAWALEHQDELGALVTLNAVSHDWPYSVSPADAICSVPVLGSLFEHTLVLPFGSAVAGARIANSFAPEAVPAAFASSPIDLELTADRFDANAEDMRLLAANVRAQSPRYGELTLPTWILVGEGDQVATPARHSHALHEQIRGSHLVPIAGAGHQLPYLHAREIIAAIDAAARAVRGER